MVGRSTVLRSNYRDAAEILELASRVVADDSFSDLEGQLSQGKRELEICRRGGTTVTVRAKRAHDLETALVTQIHEARSVMAVALGDMAVLAFKRADVAHYRGVLERAGIATVRAHRVRRRQHRPCEDRDVQARQGTGVQVRPPARPRGRAGKAVGR